MGEVLNTVAILAFLGGLGGIGFLIFSFIKKKPKKMVLIEIAVSFVVMIVAIVLMPTETITLKIPESSVKTNEEGIALISGTTNKNSEITIDGKKVENEAGSFVYELSLEDNQTQELTVVATKDKNKLTKTVKIIPSQRFVAHLKKQANEEKEQQTLEEIEAALTLAEKNPTVKNYDVASTLAQTLSKQYADVDQRLATVKEHIPIYTSVDLAEKEQNRQKLDAATALVTTATLNKKSLETRLTTLKDKIEANERLEKQLTSAREAVEKAEQEPNDTNYNQAIAKIKDIPNGQADLTNRLNTVKQTINTQKEEAKKIAEAQKVEQEAANAAAAETPVSEKVFVTSTGKKYHTHKCGNGTYTESTLDAAVARGLTPCAKCY